jgi:hypothetical protein
MKKKKVTLIIEASSTGFGIYGEDFPVKGTLCSQLMVGLSGVQERLFLL